MTRPTLPLALAAALAACDAAPKPGDAPAGGAALAVQATIPADALDLESIHFLVKKGKVKDAAALEKQINDPKEQLTNIDTDKDGQLDRIQILEQKQPDGVLVFQLRAIPSKSKDKDAAVLLASVQFTPDKASKQLIVKATYEPIFIGFETNIFLHDVPIDVQGDTIVLLEPNPFYVWVLTPARPLFIGVFVYDAPAIVVHKGKHWHKRHRWKGKWKGK